MNVAPVVERELAASARAPFTYLVRVLAVAAVLAVVFSSGVLEELNAPTIGRRLFTLLHITLFGSIWVLVPLLSCDTISRERREGTLPLLSLTALTASDVAWAKAVAHGLRALTLWLAVLPVMAIPLLLGGVAWTDFAWSALIHFISILMALGAGLLASSFTKKAASAAGFGALFGGMGVYLLALLLPIVVFFYSATTTVGPGGWASVQRPWVGLAIALNGGGIWQSIVAQPGYDSLLGYVSTLVFGVLTFLVLMGLINRRVSRAWREEPPGERITRIATILFTPMFFKAFLARWMRRQLLANPIGWLEHRTWSGRLVTWVWFAVIISFYITAFTESWLIYRVFQLVQVLMGWSLVGAIAASASGSFRRERETGVLELILVSPLSEGNIIFGRLRGLWTQFLPAMLMLCSVWVYFESVPMGGVDLLPMFLFMVMFVTVPIVGLHFSLASTNNIAALVRTVFVSIVLPVGVVNVVRNYVGMGLSDTHDYRVAFTLLAACLHAGLGAFFARRLHSRLKHRSFPFQNS